jgi:hypothetical protein
MKAAKASDDSSRFYLHFPRIPSAAACGRAQINVAIVARGE